MENRNDKFKYQKIQLIDIQKDKKLKNCSMK